VTEPYNKGAAILITAGSLDTTVDPSGRSEMFKGMAAHGNQGWHQGC
jgi:hypothetical protein